MKTHLQALMMAYTACDVLAEVRKMAAWLASNPLKLKTYGGMGKFVNSWLSRAHDCGGSPSFSRKGAEGFAEVVKRTQRSSAEMRRVEMQARESWQSIPKERPQ